MPRLAAFDAALRQLAQGDATLKRRVIAAAAACIATDGKVTFEEQNSSAPWRPPWPAPCRCGPANRRLDPGWWARGAQRAAGFIPRVGGAHNRGDKPRGSLTRGFWPFFCSHFFFSCSLCSGVSRAMIFSRNSL